MLKADLFLLYIYIYQSCTLCRVYNIYSTYFNVYFFHAGYIRILILFEIQLIEIDIVLVHVPTYVEYLEMIRLRT